MVHTHSIFRSGLLALVFTATQPAVHGAAEAVRVVLQNGRSIPISSLTAQADKLVVQTDADGYRAGQVIALLSADHVYGDKPAAINQGIALLLMGDSKEAQKLLEPVVLEQRVTARISGNYWLEAARALLVARALNGDAPKAGELGKEISEATPAQGIDPFVSLGKALLLADSVKVEERELALRDLTTDNQPADVSAYASFFRGNLCKKDKRNPDALEAYLSVPCLYPFGGLVLNAAAEIQGADLLANLKRPDEAKALLKSAALSAPGTILVEEANKRLESLK